MADRNSFGRSVTFRYIPAADGETFVAFELLSARLYSAFPSDAQRDYPAGGDAPIQELTAWTCENPQGTGPAYYRLTFDPIADPLPTSTATFEKYYVALNFQAEQSGPTVQDVEQCPVFRVDGLQGKIRVTAQDVYDLDQTIESLAPSTLWTEAKIQAAVEDIEARLEALGYARNRVFNWDKLEAATRRLACAYCCYDLAGEGSTFWFEKAKLWDSKADSMFNAAKFGYDASGSDDPDPTAAVSSGPVAFRR